MIDESSESYNCHICKFVTFRKSNMTAHKASKKHNKNIEKFSSGCKHKCGLCNYHTDNNSHFKRHLKCAKHIEKEKKECLSYNKSEDISMPIIDSKCKSNNGEYYIHDQTKLEMDEIKEGFRMMEGMFCELIKSNQQLANLVQNGTNSMINSCNNNNTFNLHFFLNETCKDALNMTDFIESIEVSVSDLKKLGNQGYVEGISSLIIDKLNELDVTKRPIHSSDAKRYTIYIKDDDVWEKDEKYQIKKVLWDIARLETLALQKGSHDNFPKFEERNSKDHDDYWRIFYNAMGGKDGDIDDLQNKVIKKIVKSVIIDKNVY